MKYMLLRKVKVYEIRVKMVEGMLQHLRIILSYRDVVDENAI
jgi:hypothetical protein